MARHLGELGTPREAHEDTFGYFGATLRVNPDLTDVMILDLFEDMERLETDEDKISLVAVNAAFRKIGSSILHPDDVEAFWERARANRQGIEDLTGLAKAIVEAVTERPTVLPSGSSDGQPSIASSSTDDVSLRALRLLDGRPDLQVAVLRPREAQVG